MRKKITCLFSAAIVVVVSMTLFVACGKTQNYNNVDKFSVHKVSYGNDFPSSLTPKVAINKDMSAIQMLEAGMENHYNADFVTKLSNENVQTSLGMIKSSQYVDSVVYRMGKANDDAKFLIDNRTGSQFIKMWEESVFRGADKIDFRVALNDNVKYNAKADDKFDKVKNWNSEESYTSVEQFVEKKVANPTKIWPFITTEETMLEQSKVWQDSATDTYRFAILFDVEKALDTYGDVLKYNLEMAGNKLENFKYETVKLEVVMWSNGFIRSVNITQVYDMKIQVDIGLKFKGNSRNVSTGLMQFSYNESEVEERVSALKDYDQQKNAV